MIEATGYYSLANLLITGREGSKLFITAVGDYSSYSSEVICPPDTIMGKEYLSEGACNIDVSELDGFTIRSMDGWNSVNLTCAGSSCSDGGYLVCGADLRTQWRFEPKY